MASISEAFRAWLMQPVLEQLKKTQEAIMAETAKDIDAETTKLASLISKVSQDFSTAIADLQAAIAAGNTDLTPQVNALAALEAPLQALDDAAQTVINPPAPTPPTAA